MDVSDLKGAPPQLATARLDLVWPRAAHAAAVCESVNSSLGELRFVAWAQPGFDDDAARRFCEADAERVAAGDCLIYFAFERESGRFVGNLDLHHFDFRVPRCQIGYVGDARMARRGLMREAALALVDLAFGLGVERVEAWCDLRNTRSIQFAQGLGMQYEGVLRGIERDAEGALCDQVLLARLKGDAPPG
ncbi:MAG: GNAT family N-acetyltransferase [Burkholderiales bacterium]|nr:GNAT family N-acetyltransferase [Burkholderiales bacterium]MDE2453621.1 GNAT family N-acetyltransferase [Burkholderiales bacterium]